MNQAPNVFTFIVSDLYQEISKISAQTLGGVMHAAKHDFEIRTRPGRRDVSSRWGVRVSVGCFLAFECTYLRTNDVVVYRPFE